MAVEGLTAGSSGDNKGIAFLVSAGVMYEVIAAACSSPQTTELNAQARSGTLMKWVHIGVGQGVLFVVLAALFQPREAVPILVGGTLAGGILYWSYDYAKKSGLANGGPPTEAHNAPPGTIPPAQQGGQVVSLPLQNATDYRQPWAA